MATRKYKKKGGWTALKTNKPVSRKKTGTRYNKVNGYGKKIPKKSSPASKHSK